MRQVKFQLGEVLNFGLLKSNPGAVNQKGFLELVNLRPWATQLKYVDRISEVTVAETTQTFQTNLGVFGCSSTAVSKFVDGEFVPQDVEITPSQNLWSIADFAKFIILSNGTNKVYVDADGVCSTEKPFDTDLPEHNSLTHAGGQLILGGLSSSFNELDNSYVAWSRIGAIDFTLSNDNESGFHCPQIGEVFDVLPFEKGFLAFGATGVTQYFPSGITFGNKKLSTVGVLGKGFCASNEDGAFFVDIHGQLNRIVPGKADTELLDYAWILGGKDVRLFLSTATDELWIQNSTGNFVVNKYGMYQVSLEVCGVFTDEGTLKAAVKTGTQTDAWFRTSKLDFNIGGLKTISEVYAQDSSAGTKHTEITVTKNGTDYVSRNFLENTEGVTHPGLTGNVMSVKRTTENFTSGEISNFHIQTVRVDGRSGLGYVGGQNQ